MTCIPGELQPYCISPDNGFGYSELFHIGQNHKSTGADEYVFVAAKTEMHEIGHSLGVGKLDDRSLIEDPLRKFARNGEVYSGRPADSTPEITGGSNEWSIMSSGWNTELVNEPMNGEYYAFSIEELLSVNQ